MIPGIVAGMSVSRNKGFRGLSLPPRAIVNNVAPEQGFSKLAPRINDASVLRARYEYEKYGGILFSSVNDNQMHS